MKKTPLAQLNKIVLAEISLICIKGAINDFNAGRIEVLRQINDKIKELLPAERKMVEDAFDNGWNDASNYDTAMYCGENPKCTTPKDYFDQNYEQ